MELKIGNKEKFFAFLKNVKSFKTALISHIDLDGITVAKIIREVVTPNEIKFVEYEELNLDLVKELREGGFKKIIFTDLYIKDKEFVRNLEEFAEVLIVDHHLAPDWNSDKTTFILGEGYSTGYLCYEILSEIKNLEEWDWLVACSCISDYCHIKPEKWLGKVFKKYGDALEYVGTYVRKSGKFWDLQYEISLALIYFKANKKMNIAFNSIGKSFGETGVLKKYASQIKDNIDSNVKRFENEKEFFNGGYFFQIKSSFPVGSIVSSILSGQDLHKLFFIITSEKKLYRVSVRRQDKKFDCSSFLQNLLKGLPQADGGGHIPAAGGHFRKEDLPEIRRRLGLKK